MTANQLDLRRQAVAHFPPDVASAAAARHFVMGRLRRWNVEFQAEGTMLLVSEVVTNAVTHVHSDVTVTVRMSVDGDTLRVEVGDDSPLSPHVRTIGPFDECGRGMFLVDALSSRWGVDRQATASSDNPGVDGPGKTVWFEMRRTPASPE